MSSVSVGSTTGMSGAEKMQATSMDNWFIAHCRSVYVLKMVNSSVEILPTCQVDLKVVKSSRVGFI